MAGFIFGAPGLPKTQQELDNLRKITQAMALRQQPAPRNIGEGLSAIGNALAYRSMLDQLNSGAADLASKQAGLWPQIGAMFGGGAPAAAPAPAPAPANPAPSATIVPNDTSKAALDVNPMADTPAPLSGGSVAPTVAPVADASMPRGFRNNNPLNIEAGNFTQSQPGFTGSDGRFAKFSSMDQGLGAADSLLRSYAGKGINTVSGIVNRWAPPSDNNPTNVYAATVAKAIGVDPNAPINMNDPNVRRGVIEAMAKFENGRPLPSAVPAAPNAVVGAGDALASLLGPASAYADTPKPGDTLLQQPQAPVPVAAAPVAPSTPLPPQQQIAQALTGGFTPGAMPNVTNLQTKPVDLPAGMGAREAVTRALMGQTQAPQAAPAAPTAPAPAAAPVTQAPADQRNQRAIQAMQFLKQHPELNDTQKAIVGKVIQDGMKQPDLKPQTVNGRVYAFDPASGGMKDVTPSGVGFHPLVTPQERAQFGIDPADHRPYQIGPDNKLVTPPGAPTVNIDQRAPNEFEKTYGEGMGKRALGVIEAGDKAANDYQQAQLLKNLLSGIQTGKLTQAGGTMGAWLQAAGLDPKLVGIDPNLPASTEAAGALINKMALSGIGAGNGGIPANNFSEADRNFMVKTVPGLANRPEANDVLLAVKERQALLAMEQANRWADARANGTSYEKFEQQWRKELQSRDVFGDLAKRVQAAGAPQQQGQGKPFAPPSNWQFSPSRQQYRDPQGNVYDMNGQPVR